LKITNLKVALFGPNPVLRIETDEGICGYSQIETRKDYLKPHILYYKEFILGEDPTNVEKVMLRIRRVGAFKPWGASVSAIEMALWDIAGKAAGLPVYKLLGGKVRDRVLCYNGGIRFPLNDHTPEDYIKSMERMKALPENFRIIKEGIGFHSAMSRKPDYHYGTIPDKPLWQNNSGPLTEWGLDYTIDCVKAMKSVLGNEIGLALDCGPGFLPSDAIRLARALEPFNLLWMEDLITGDYTPYVKAKVYRDITMSTSTPIHTGEQIYLRENFMELIETQAVNVVGPDPCDVGGIAELKWIAEYARLHGILIAPHGVGDGLFGLAALIQVAATLPENYIGFEYPIPATSWWYDIVTGLPDPIVVDSHITVGDAPGMGLDFIEEKAREYLREEDAGFFDL
jgi:L-alanine-DL-glutamate epimerase-like enolase superfamily enzyme